MKMNLGFFSLFLKLPFPASESVPTSGEVTGGLGEATAAAPAIEAAAPGGLPTASGDASAATGDFLGCDDLRTKGSCWPLVFVKVSKEKMEEEIVRNGGKFKWFFSIQKNSFKIVVVSKRKVRAVLLLDMERYTLAP